MKSKGVVHALECRLEAREASVQRVTTGTKVQCVNDDRAGKHALQGHKGGEVTTTTQKVGTNNDTD